MQKLRRQVALLWIAIFAIGVVMGVMVLTCDCPSRSTRHFIDDFIKKATTDPLSGKYAG